MQAGFRAVLFDLGGTLWEPFGGLDPDRVLRDAAMDLAASLLGSGPDGEKAEKLAFSIASRPGALKLARETTARVSFSAPAFREADLALEVEEAAAPFGVQASAEAVLAFGHALSRHAKLYPETLYTLRRLRTVCPGLVMGIVSNTVIQPAVMDHYLAATGLARLVDFRVLSSEMGWRKPHPAIYAAALKAAGAEPEEALFVGDRPVEDVMGPGRLGVKAILRVAGGLPQLPAGCSPIAVLNDLSEILPFLSIP